MTAAWDRPSALATPGCLAITGTGPALLLHPGNERVGMVPVRGLLSSSERIYRRLTGRCDDVRPGCGRSCAAPADPEAAGCHDSGAVVLRRLRGRHPSLLECVHRVNVRVLGALYVSVALLGALGSSLLVTFFVVPVSGALGAALARGVHRALHPHTEAPLSIHLPAAVATGLFFPFVIGMEILGSVGGPVSVAIVVLGTLVSVGWAHRIASDDTVPPTATGRGLSDADLTSFRALLRALPLEELLHEWRWTGSKLRADRHVAAQLREALLEEIDRRDPEGFQRWLLDGLEQDPERYVRATDDNDIAGHPDDPTQ